MVCRCHTVLTLGSTRFIKEFIDMIEQSQEKATDSPKNFHQTSQYDLPCNNFVQQEYKTGADEGRNWNLYALP